jgi:hypothetical protein
MPCKICSEKEVLVCRLIEAVRALSEIERCRRRLSSFIGYQSACRVCDVLKRPSECFRGPEGCLRGLQICLGARRVLFKGRQSA